jgi:kynurenine formamidase
MNRFLCLGVSLLAGAGALWATGGQAPSSALDLSRARPVDLTHPLGAETLFWPTETRPFELESIFHGLTPGGFFYSANRFCTPEHGGTHLDAPIHFGAGRRAADQVPLEQLIAPAMVIDVSVQAGRDRDYRLTLADVEAWEAAHGRIPEGAVVLLRTGWSERWPDRLRYLGDDAPGDASNLHFPAFGADAAELLVGERRVGALGLDTASLDHGPSRDFPVHRIAAAADVPGFENLTALDRLPPRGAWIVALPAKIAGGSGAPLRAVALVPPATGSR